MSKGAELFVFALPYSSWKTLAEFAFVSARMIQLLNFIMAQSTLLPSTGILPARDVSISLEVWPPPVSLVVEVQASFTLMGV